MAGERRLSRGYMIVPGLAYYALGLRTLAGVWLGFSLVLIGLAEWRSHLWLWIAAGLWWIGTSYDAWRRLHGRRPRIWPAALIALAAIYGVGWEVTEINLLAPFERFDKMRPYLIALTQPDLLTYPTERQVLRIPVAVPCTGSPSPQEIQAGARVWLSVDCAQAGDPLALRGEGFPAGAPVELWWVNPIGERQRILREGRPLALQADPSGQLHATFIAPRAVPLGFEPPPGQSQTHILEVHIVRAVGGPQPSEALLEVAEKMGETVAIALLATTFAVLIAAPLSFLAARNLMGGSPLTRVIYYAMRGFFNITRSVEPLIFGIVFVVWVGLGSFAGMLALMIHSIAALGKLFSEVVEHIDPGPVEALTATGANRLQVIRYAIVPQVVPEFVSFAVYRWDINVRMSTIIGFVGGGGIGFRLSEWIRLSAYRQVATAVIGIALVVMALDYVSAQVRRRIV
ncbi:phosphonate ABC transporter, permease protein PhnE [Thermoflexus sp.]|uniref:phosphonate ABC transporter, permease protein PhnE n=1 Tax=Thermoflexus sp. TaxID=1969742 RepID=UPI0035E42AF8